MYNPAYNRVDDHDELLDLTERARFGHLISSGSHGFLATGLPFLVDRSAGDLGRLRGHFARANEHWKVVDGSDVLVLFPLTDGYVSPSRYPSKGESGKVVPTWNYEVVHAHGSVTIHDDIEWVRQLVTALSDHHESARRQTDRDIDVVPEWSVDDAPAAFIDGQLRGIVGVEIEITRLEGKRKLSQNRSDADRLGVISGHEASTRCTDNDLAAAMRATAPAESG